MALHAPSAPNVAANRVAHALSEGLSIRPGEGTRTVLLFLQLLLASAVFVMGRTVRDTLFLSRYSISALPYMFVAYGIASALTVVVYSRVADRLARDRTMAGWTALGIATYLGTYACVKARASFIYPVFYVWAEVFANLLVSQFWTLANELHDPRAAKRLFGTIGSARVLGIIVVGLGTGTIVRAIGTEQLLLVLVCLMAAIGALALRLGREPRPVRAATPVRTRNAKAPSVTASPYVRALGLMSLLCFAALTIGDYQFKAIARATYREDALARFFSYFYAGTGLVSFVFQVFGTPRLLARYGVGLGMTIMPAVFGVASAALLGVPILPVATVMKFADNGFQFSIHETTLQALYVPFPAALKVRTRAFLDAVVKPIAYGVGGVALLAFVPLLGEPRALSYVSVTLVFGWLVVIPFVRRRYVVELERTLRTAGLAALGDEDVRDAGGRAVLLGALAAEDPRVVLAALDELGNASDPPVLEALASLAAHPDPAIRVGALIRLGPHAAATASVQDDEAIRAGLRDPEDEVRAAAATAHAVAAGDESLELLRPMLDDPSRNVRSATLAGLLAHAGFEGTMCAGARLASLVGSTDDEDRADAAHAIGAIGRSGARRLLPLLSDPSRRVRLAAIDAARSIADPRLLHPLLERFAEPATRGPAGAALASLGDAAVAPLCVLLDDDRADRATRLAAPRVLRDIRSERAYAALDALVTIRDAHVRLRVLAALSRLRRSLDLPPMPLPRLRTLVEAELRSAYALAAAYERDREVFGSALLDDHMDLARQRAGRRLLRLLELRHPPDTLRLVRERVEDEARRSNALEVLDTILDPPLRPLVLPFFDDVPTERKLGSLRGVVVPDAATFAKSLLEDPNPYVAMIARDALRRRNHPLAHQGTTDERIPEVPMYSTVEKLLLLRTAPMFAKIRGEDLAPLARVAEVETYDDGEYVFREGDSADALYVVVRGAIRIERKGERLATLGSGQPFGEMAVLDAEARSADAVSEGRSEVLRIGSEEFYDALREQVEIAEGVMRMLSQRLREANASIEAHRH